MSPSFHSFFDEFLKIAGARTGKPVQFKKLHKPQRYKPQHKPWKVGKAMGSGKIQS